MAYTNTGGYRMQDLTVTKYVDGAVASGYPTTYKITAISDNGERFVYDGGYVTETILAQLPEGTAVTSGTYLHLLEEFKAWVEAFESDLDVDSVETNDPYGVNATWCPLYEGGGGVPG